MGARDVEDPCMGQNPVTPPRNLTRILLLGSEKMISDVLLQQNSQETIDLVA